MMFLSTNFQVYYQPTAEQIQEDLLLDWLPAVHYLMTIFGCIFAVIAVCKHTAYLKNKVSADFFGSMPMRRGQLYLTSVFASFCSVIIPFIVNLIITFAILAAKGLITQALVTDIFKSIADLIGYSSFCLAVTTVVSTVTGLTAVTLALTAEALAIIPAGLAVFVAFFDLFVKNMWTDYYFSEQTLKYTSPLLRLVIDTAHLSLIEFSAMLLVSAVLLIGAYFIYLKRKNERSGMPVVFDTLGEVIKYIDMVLITLFAGFVFYNVTERSYGWMIFGMICGIVLSFMLLNTILTKNAKAMFKNAKGLAICGGAMAAFTAVVILNPFGLIDKLPSTNSIASVRVSFDSYEGFEFEDEAVIDSIRAIYLEANKQNDIYEYASYGGREILLDGLVTSYVDFKDSVSMDVVFYPKFGLPVAKSVYINDKNALIEEFRTVLNSNEFAEQYSTLANEYIDQTDAYVHLSTPNYVMGIKNDVLWYGYSGIGLRLNKPNYDSRYTKEGLAIDAIIADTKNVNFDYFQSQHYGTLNISGNSAPYNDIQIPLRTELKDVESTLLAEGILLSSASEQIDRYAEVIDEIKVYKYGSTAENGEKLPYMSVTDKDMIREILLASSNIFTHGTNCETFEFIDREYYAVIDYDVFYGDNAKYHINLTNEEVAERTDEDSDIVYRVEKGSSSLSFRYGMIPEFIAEYFN